jgi:hypothetical protein
VLIHATISFLLFPDKTRYAQYSRYSPPSKSQRDADAMASQFGVDPSLISSNLLKICSLASPRACESAHVEACTPSRSPLISSERSDRCSSDRTMFATSHDHTYKLEYVPKAGLTSTPIAAKVEANASVRSFRPSLTVSGALAQSY